MVSKIKSGVIGINKIRSNPFNPRLIKSKAFQRLKASIQSFPEMLNTRPIVIDENYIVIGGNMRLAAVRELGWNEVPVVFAQALDELKKREFIIKDNISAGEWDYSQLSTWSKTELSDWGIDLPAFKEATLEEIKIKPFEKVHVLISFAPKLLVEIQDYLYKIKDTEGVDYEQNIN